MKNNGTDVNVSCNIHDFRRVEEIIPKFFFTDELNFELTELSWRNMT